MTASATVAVILCDMPRTYGWPLALCTLWYGVHLVRREATRPMLSLLINASGAAISMADGQPMRGLSIQWRGPLAFLRWRGDDGQQRALSFWPDTLSAGRRRELRLAMPIPAAAPAARSVAP